MGAKGIFTFIRIMNVLTGIFLIVISVFSILNVPSWLTFEVFLIPCPFFIGVFGIVLIGAELKIKFILKKVAFLKSMLGRGIFSIYLSSTAFWFLHNSQVFAWIAALTLFISGIIYIALHFGWSKKLQQQYDEEQRRQERKKILNDNDTPQVRQNLI